MKRFWSKINKNGPIHPYNKKLRRCWTWTACKDKQSYGSFWHKGKNRRAHRVAFEIYNSIELTLEQKVLHSCDNTLCCNPAHLRIGTQKDNKHDSITRNRHQMPAARAGEDCNLSVLSESDVKEIRTLYKSGGYTAAELAVKFGLYADNSKNTIYDIVKMRSWKHVK